MIKESFHKLWEDLRAFIGRKLNENDQGSYRFRVDSAEKRFENDRVG